MKLAIGADHRGSEVLNNLRNYLSSHGYTVEPFGSLDGQLFDYPDAAYKVAVAVSDGRCERGILICGSGIGMSIAANKVARVRAALIHDELDAEISRRHNDANVLCLPAGLVGSQSIERIVGTWLETPFEGGRHARRNNKIHLIEQGHDPTATRDVQSA